MHNAQVTAPRGIVLAQCVAQARQRSQIHICGPRTYVRKEQKEPERWCFGERKRRTGTWQLLDDAQLLEDPEYMSYWEPVWVYKCDGCGEDHMYGFGMQRVWD